MKRDIFRRWALRPDRLLWAGFTVLLLIGCGMYDQDKVASVGNTGSVTFSVEWGTSQVSPGVQALEAPSAQPLAATDVCIAYGLNQVHLEVWRDGTLPTSTGVSATAPCTDHTATLAGVPAQVPDLYVKLTTTPAGWEGESARFTLGSGATQDLGEIYVVPPPQWHAAESIGVNSANTSDPDVGMDDSGNAIAVWKQGTDRIYASRFTPGAGWGAETFVASGGIIFIGHEPTLTAPQIAMGANGDAIATWKVRFWDAGSGIWRNRVEAGRYTPTGGWELSSPVSGFVESELDIGDPGIAMDDSGNAVVVWSMNTSGPTGTVYDTFASRYSATSNSWASTRLTALATGNNALYPHVAMAGSGSAMVVWEETTGDIYAQRFDGAAWENTPAVIGTWNSAVLSAEPRVAVDESRNAIAVWRSHEIAYYPGGPGTRPNINQVISANRYAASSGAWGDTSSIVDIGEARGEIGHQVAMDSDGNAVACWNWVAFDILSSSGGGDATRYDALSGQWDVSTSSVGGCDDIGMDDTGNAIIIFRPYISFPFTDPHDVRASHYNAATMAWEMPVLLQTDAQGDGPRIAVNGAGETVAVWTQSDGSWIRPYASRYY